MTRRTFREDALMRFRSVLAAFGTRQVNWWL
jgi:hypothetical protein